MKMHEAFPSPFLKAVDLEGEAVRAKIKSVDWETVGSEKKPVMSFFGGRLKPMVLNKTNYQTLADAFGSDDSDDFIDGYTEIFSARVSDPTGRLVDGLRLRGIPRTPKPGASVKVAPTKPNPPTGGQAEAAPPVEAYEDLNDSIDDAPF